MSPWGVPVSIIEPGRFKTNVSDSIPESVTRLWNDLSTEMKEDYGEKYYQKCKSCFVLYPTIQLYHGRGGNGVAFVIFMGIKLQILYKTVYGSLFIRRVEEKHRPPVSFMTRSS